MPRKQPKTVHIGDMIYWSSGDDLGECSNRRCNEPAFSYNEDGNLFCEECLEEWHEEQESKGDGDSEDDDYLSSDDDGWYPEECGGCGRMEDWCICKEEAY